MKPPEGYVTPKHAARIVGCSLATIFRWINTHKVQAVRTDGPGRKRQHVFVSRDSLDAMMHVVPANNFQPVAKPKTSAFARAYLASIGVG